MVETTVFYQANGNTSMSKLNDKLLVELVTIGRKMDVHVFAIKPWEEFSERLAVANSTVDPHPNERGHEILAAGMANYIIANGLIPK